MGLPFLIEADDRVEDEEPGDHRSLGEVTASKKFLGGIFLDVRTAGSLIDMGNAFVDLNEMRNVAMQRYVTGQAQHGWKDRLPRPIQPVFTETTCIILEKGVDVLLSQVIPGFIPLGAVVVGAGRWVLEIRGERQQAQHAFERDDVDDMLDLKDQLTQSASEAQRYIDIVSDIRRTLEGQP